MTIEPLESRIAPASVVVTTLSDVPVNGKVTLREAIASAGSGGVVTFSPTLHGTIHLQSTLDIGNALTITGIGTNGHNKITLSGGNSVGIVNISGTGDVTLADLNFTAGKAGDGGAIYSSDTGTVTISYCSLTKNQALASNGTGAGGAIDVKSGTLELVNSKLSGNVAQGAASSESGGYGRGGAVYLAEGTTADLSMETFSKNSAIGGLGTSVGGGRGQGGAVFADGTVTVETSTFSNNLALGGNSGGNANTVSSSHIGAGGGAGGALYEASSANVTVTGSTFSHNSAVGGNGLNGAKGASVAAGERGNTGGYGGYGGYASGGAAEGSGYLKLASCTLSGNLAKGGNGGKGGAGGAGGPKQGATKQGPGGNGGEGGYAGDAYGGALAVQYTGNSLVITSSTISGSIATGGHPGKGGAPGAGAHGNPPASAGKNAGQSNSYGGAIDSDYSTLLSLSGVTVSGNSASYGGGVHSYNGSTVTITNSTISGNKAGSNAGLEFGTAHTTPTVTVSDSTVSGNVAKDSAGGIYAYDVAITLSQVTVADNTARQGAGVVLDSTGNTIDNSTIAFNHATTASGGGLVVADTDGATLTSTVVADNTAGRHGVDPDVEGSINAYYSLFGNTTGLTISSATTTDLLGKNPLLDALKDNGGDTKTILFKSSSPLIDNGTNTPNNLIYDQRGSPYLREIGGDTDIGAVQLQVVM